MPLIMQETYDHAAQLTTWMISITLNVIHFQGYEGLGKERHRAILFTYCFFLCTKRTKITRGDLEQCHLYSVFQWLVSLWIFCMLRKNCTVFCYVRETNKSCTVFKDSHIAIFTGPTGCVKSHFLSDLIEKEYNKYLHHHYLLNTLMEQHVSH